MGINPFYLHCDDSSVQGQVNEQRKDCVAGRASKVPWTEKGIRKRGLSETVSKLEAVLSSCKASRE